VTTPPALATAKRTARTHVVCSGQRIDTIAKRYGVSSDELRRANGLRTGAMLKIGQRLTIPGSAESDEGEREQPATNERERPAASEKTKPAILKASLSAPAAEPIRHRVMHGETLAQIALRYGTSVAALSAKNKLDRTQGARPGQLLTLPNGAKRVQKSWHPYVRAVKQKGYLDVSTPISHFSGPVVESSGRLRSSAVRTLNDLLGAGGEHPALPERLVRLLVQVSDTFGGRPIRLVSGYRTASYYQDSRHKQSSAIDFLVVGVPNAAVCDYLRELEDVGVGYYPNSSFVHLDVRNHFAYWVDYAGPGEPPRSTPNAPAAPKSSRADRKLLAELEGLLKRAKGAIEQARTRAGKKPPSSDAKPEREHDAEPQRPERDGSLPRMSPDET
jgi:LysM repeat protein